MSESRRLRTGAAGGLHPKSSVDSVLAYEFSDLLNYLRSEPFEWEDWGKCRGEKERSAELLLDKLKALHVNDGSVDQWRVIFAAAMQLRIANTISEYARRINNAEEVVSKTRFQHFLKKFPPADIHDELRRKEAFSNQKLSEEEQRKKLKELLAKAKELSASLKTTLVHPLTRGFLIEAGAVQLSESINQFTQRCNETAQEQRYQKNNAASLRLKALSGMVEAFNAMTGKPCFELVAEIERLIRCTSNGRTPTADSIRKALRAVNDRSLRGQK